MKFFHLADLHIGKNVNGFSMIEEQQHVFARIIDMVRAEQPDAVLIAGDVYDRAVPGIEAVRVFDDFLTGLAREGPAVLLISGNHDSPERLSFAGRLLCENRLFLCGTCGGAPEKITLADQFGAVHFWLLPFIKPSSVCGYFGDRNIETYEDAVAAVIGAADIDYTARNVLVSHQFFTKAGITPDRSESEQNAIGGLDAVDARIIERFDYAALGHLHGAQKAGADHLRYAGSPLKYSFSEVFQTKSVVMAELREKGSVTARLFPLVPIHDMREIKGELKVLISDAVSSLADKNDYLRVTLTDEHEIVDPMGKIRSVYPNVMALDFENTRSQAGLSGASPDIAQTAQAMHAAQLSPYDLFDKFFREANGIAMNRRQEKIIRELLETEDAE